MKADKPPIAVVGSGPSGLINAYLLAVEGFPVTVFEAFHELGGVLRYGIPEFRLPNDLIDDVVGKITLLGGRFVRNFVVGKTATLDDLKAAGFWKIFVGTGAGLPTFMNVPGEHLLGVMSANEFLTRVNLMRAIDAKYETPLPDTAARKSSSSAAATPRWTRRVRRGASAPTSRSSIAARSGRCRRASRNCTTRSRKASACASCVPRASSSATARPTSSRTPCSTSTSLARPTRRAGAAR